MLLRKPETRGAFPRYSSALLTIPNRLRRRSAHLNLVADFLDFCVLLFRARNHSFHSFLQLTDCRLEILALLGNRRLLLLKLVVLLLHFLVLFQKLVEQHRVNGLVAHAIGLPLLVANDQVGVDRFYVFGNETELRYTCWVLLVLEGDRFQREDRVARVIHWFNVVLEATG